MSQLQLTIIFDDCFHCFFSAQFDCLVVMENFKFDYNYLNLVSGFHVFGPLTTSSRHQLEQLDKTL